MMKICEEFENLIFKIGGKNNYRRRRCRPLKPLKSAVIYSIFSQNSDLFKQNENAFCEFNDFNILLFCIIKIVIFNYFMKLIFNIMKINFISTNFKIYSKIMNLFQLNFKGNLKSNLILDYKYFL